MAAEDNELTRELQTLLDEGQKIEAIRRYRQATGVGLAEAKAAMEALERGEQPAAQASVDPALETEVVSLLQGGHKIEAIKLYRKKTGVDLKGAKDAVESLAAARGLAVPKAGCLGVLLLVILPLAALALVGVFAAVPTEL